jgi:serine/threonine protein kinase
MNNIIHTAASGARKQLAVLAAATAVVTSSSVIGSYDNKNHSSNNSSYDSTLNDGDETATGAATAHGFINGNSTRNGGSHRNDIVNVPVMNTSRNSTCTTATTTVWQQNNWTMNMQLPSLVVRQDLFQQHQNPSLSSSSSSLSNGVCYCEASHDRQTTNNRSQHDSSANRSRLLQSQSSFLAASAASSSAASVTLPPIDTPRTQRVLSLLRKRRTMKRLGESKTNADIESKYIWDRDQNKVGEGAYSTVYQAVRKDFPTEKVALKEISKQYTDHMNFQQEIEAMLYIQQKGGHPHLMGLHEHFETKDSYILVLDFIQGGELFDHLIQNGAYSELDASRIVRDIASALNFLHGIGIVHADLKPENVLLSTSRRGDSVIKVADFGTAVFVGDPLVNDDVAVDEGDDDRIGPEPCYGAPTPAYSPPECILRTTPIQPSMDMWALGVILFIMLTGCHPYDVSGESTDEEIEERIKDRWYRVPLRNKQIAGHLSPSARDLIKKLMNRDPNKRLTAYEMLQHPWVRGETATTAVISGSDKRLSNFNVVKTQMQVKFFENAVKWSDERAGEGETARRKVSLIERSFKELDPDQRGFLEIADIIGKDCADDGTHHIVEGDGPVIHMSDFENLLSENMKNKYFPAGHVVYREGDTGNAMYFLESGTIEVAADGTRALRSGGDFFGEGALLHSDKKRSATVKCLTPVHAYEISREYFEKYISHSSGLYLTLKEKDKIRKRNRAKTILRMQKGLKTTAKPRKAKFFSKDEEGDSLFILESGKVDIEVNGKMVLSVFPGNMFGEHSVMTGWKRNCDARCVAKEGCVAQELQGETFRDLVHSSPSMQQALKELQLRREFKKAIVLRTRKEFPYLNPEAAFEAADDRHLGRLDLDTVAKLMRELNPDYTDDDIRDVLATFDFTQSGNVTFDEMKKALIGDKKASASM